MRNSETDPEENMDANRETHFSTRDGEFLLALLTLCGFVILQPGVTLNKGASQ